MAPARSRDRSAADLLESPHGRLLLGGPPAASAACGAHRELRDQTLDLEALAVRGAPGRHDRVLRQRDLPRLEQLLQERLRILSERAGIEAGEQRLVEPPDGLAGGREVAVEEDRAHQRLE